MCSGSDVCCERSKQAILTCRADTGADEIPVGRCRAGVGAAGGKGWPLLRIDKVSRTGWLLWKITHSNNWELWNEPFAAHPRRALTAWCYAPPDVPDMAGAPTLLHHFSEEGTPDVRVGFVGVYVFLTQLDILSGPGLQTVQSVGKEEPANLQRGHMSTRSWDVW